jgi:hypothetical protein
MYNYDKLERKAMIQNQNQNPQIGKQVFINGQEGQVVDFKDDKYIIFTDTNEYHLDNLDNIFCPDSSHEIPTVYIQIGIIMETLRLIVVPQKQEDGTFKAEIDYTKMGKSSEIREAIRCLSKSVQHYDKGMRKKSHLPKEAFEQVGTLGEKTIDTITLLYYAMLTMSLSKQEALRGEIEQMLWRIAQTEE